MTSTPGASSATALLIMDVQIGPVELHADDGFVARLRKAIDAARASAVRIIFVEARFRAGYEEVSPRSRVYSGIAATGGLKEGDPGLPFHPLVAPESGDVVVTKRRTSAFSGSDLEIVLRSQGIDTLVLTGVRTSGVVEATLREAVDRDYNVVTLDDGCADVDPDLHRMLIDKVCARYGDVLTIDAWCASLGEKV